MLPLAPVNGAEDAASGGGGGLASTSAAPLLLLHAWSRVFASFAFAFASRRFSCSLCASCPSSLDCSTEFAKRRRASSCATSAGMLLSEPHRDAR